MSKGACPEAARDRASSSFGTSSGGRSPRKASVRWRLSGFTHFAAGAFGRIASRTWAMRRTTSTPGSTATKRRIVARRRSPTALLALVLLVEPLLQRSEVVEDRRRVGLFLAGDHRHRLGPGL